MPSPDHLSTLEVYQLALQKIEQLQLAKGGPHMRKDRQHKEWRAVCLGMPIYYGSEKADPHFWKLTLHAAAVIMMRHNPELEKKKIGASTGAVWLTRLALEWMPEPYKSEIQAEYLILEAERQAAEAVRTANTPAT